MPTNPPTVCVLGSYARALVLTTDRIPSAGETLVGRDFRQTHGGKGSDMAVQARRLGADVEIAGVIGEDDFGRAFLQLLEDEGIGHGQVRVTNERPTGVGVILKDTAARNVIVVDLGANELFGPGDLERAAATIDAADVTLAQLEIPLATAIGGLTIAHQAGRVTILNPAPATDLRGLDLSAVDVLTPNETEARLCAGRAPDDPIANAELAAELLATGARSVVMTLGDQGAAVFGADGSQQLIAPHRIEVVDSNGAGDSFNAGLAVGLAEGLPLGRAAGFAGAVAALCCQGWETVPSYRDRRAVEDFLAGTPDAGAPDGGPHQPSSLAVATPAPAPAGLTPNALTH